VDEAHRMSDSGRMWLTNRYPLIDASMMRSDCESILLSHGLPIPRKSACVFCPWHSNRAWQEVRDHDPVGWAKAITYDARLRTQRGAYVHRKMKPLADVNLRTQARLDLDGFGNDCVGMCGV